mmetsp:Transcript_7199/g.12953  ORF Transcript_7199/g.12953 Transcript_7199/m.12953 type:complete len:334 (+) Transcript_7199:642-1643(+)
MPPTLMEVAKFAGVASTMRRLASLAVRRALVEPSSATTNSRLISTTLPRTARPAQLEHEVAPERASVSPVARTPTRTNGDRQLARIVPPESSPRKRPRMTTTTSMTAMCAMPENSSTVPMSAKTAQSASTRALIVKRPVLPVKPASIAESPARPAVPIVRAASMQPSPPPLEAVAYPWERRSASPALLESSQQTWAAGTATTALRENMLQKRQVLVAQVAHRPRCLFPPLPPATSATPESTSRTTSAWTARPATSVLNPKLPQAHTVLVALPAFRTNTIRARVNYVRIALMVNRPLLALVSARSCAKPPRTLTRIPMPRMTFVAAGPDMASLR